MNITKSQLKKIIKEELESTLSEELPVPRKSDLPGPLGVASDLSRGLWYAILSHLEETVPEDDPKKPDMNAAAKAAAEKERGYSENPNNPERMAETKGNRQK